MHPDTAVGGPVDVYELAKTLWVLAASEPFAPLGPQAPDGGKYTLDRWLAGHPLAEELDRLIEACTRTDPDLRPTMVQVAADLRAWIAMSDRRAAGEDHDALRDAATELRAAFADDLTAGRLQEQRVALARRRITVLSYGIEQLANEVRQQIPGAVSQTNHHQTATASLMRYRNDERPEPVMRGLSAVVVRPRQDPSHPELVLGVVGELEVDGEFAIRAGVFLDWPGIDYGEQAGVFESAAPVDSTETENAVEAAVKALRDAAPEWLVKLRERSV